VNVNATDNALMAAVGAGEVQKLAVLFERHHRGLFRYFVSMNRNRELSEDLVQDVFFRMLRYRASYDAQQSFTAWMYQIARNASVDSAQKRRGEVVGIDEFTEHKPDQGPGPEESAVRTQDLRLLRLALDRLPADKKEILVLSRFQGMKYEELAGVLGCEVGTVKVRVYRAMRALEQAYLTISGEKTA
jgi:RNA polymerase sigma factor (sigma-70 family)